MAAAAAVAAAVGYTATAQQQGSQPAEVKEARSLRWRERQSEKAAREAGRQAEGEEPKPPPLHVVHGGARNVHVLFSSLLLQVVGICVDGCSAVLLPTAMSPADRVHAMVVTRHEACVGE